MTEYTATCKTDEDDTITARVDGESVELRAKRYGRQMMEAFLLPANARTFARGILALADDIDGGEADPNTRPKVGDRLRVTQDDPWWAPVKINDVITVAETAYDRADGSQDGVRFQEHEDTYLWHVPLSSVEGPLADWEVDLLTASEPESVPVPRDAVVSVRGDFVTQARELLAGTDPDAADVIRLAEFLAAGE